MKNIKVLDRCVLAGELKIEGDVIFTGPVLIDGTLEITDGKIILHEKAEIGVTLHVRNPHEL